MEHEPYIFRWTNPLNPLRSPEDTHYKPGQFAPQQLMKRSFIKTIVVQMTGAESNYHP